MLMVGGGGWSSLMIVPTPSPSASVAPTGFDRLTVNASLDSIAVSPFTCTVTGCDVWPALKLTVPLAAM